MKIIDLLNRGEKTYSFEFYPPKTFSSTLELGINIGQLMKLSPSFISVTYGAGGSTQAISFDLIDYIQNKLGLCSMAHYTCVNATKEKVKSDLEHLEKIGIKNLMLLRGDLPVGENVLNDDFRYASDLIRFAAGVNKFCIGAAGYPEGHLESADVDTDIKNLKYKVEQGADFLVTQMFFDNEYYFRFVEKCKAAGIDVPIIPGIIPIINFKQIRKFSDMCGASIPAELAELMEQHQDDPDKKYQIGVDFAIKQCNELLQNGAPGLHFYTLNKSRATVDIFEAIDRP